MDDLISRQEAIDTICGECQGKCIPCEHYPCGEIKALEQLPSAEPEQKNGKWIEHKWAEEVDGFLISNYECSYCQSWERNKRNYCPECGAKMEVE